MKILSKPLQRQQLLAQRSELKQDLKITFDQNIRNNLESVELFQNAKIVHTYWSYGSEIDTHWILQTDKQIIVPKVKNTESMLHCVINRATVFEIKNKIEEPNKNYKIMENLEEIDIVVVPLLAFDKELNRIGYGGGYYDRFLSELKELNPKIVTIGLAYEFQLVDKIQTEPHDIALDYMVTESEIYFVKI
jgi:5-formyltetrahydrofolate cyclo-ligase